MWVVYTLLLCQDPNCCELTGGLPSWLWAMTAASSRTLVCNACFCEASQKAWLLLLQVPWWVGLALSPAVRSGLPWLLWMHWWGGLPPHTPVWEAWLYLLPVGGASSSPTWDWSHSGGVLGPDRAAHQVSGGVVALGECWPNWGGLLGVVEQESLCRAPAGVGRLGGVSRQGNARARQAVLSCQMERVRIIPWKHQAS